MSNNGKYDHHQALKAFFETTAMSDFCSWLYAEDRKDYTLYETTEGIGFIYQVAVAPFLGESLESGFTQIFNSTYPKDTIIQFFCYASENIKPYIDAYRNYHSCVPNIDKPHIISEMINKRADFIENAATNGFWEGIKFRPRVFKNIISFLIPYSSFNNNAAETYSRAKEIAMNVKGMLKGIDLHPHNLDATGLKTILREIFNCGVQGITECDNHSEMRRQVVANNTSYSIIDDNHFNTDLRIRHDGMEKYIRTFTVSGYPREMDLWKFNNILFNWDSREVAPPMYAPFCWSLSVKYVDWKIAKHKLMLKTAENIRQSEGNKLARYLPKIAKKAEESRYVANLLDDNAIPLPSYFTLFLVENTKSGLDYLTEVAINKLAQKGFVFEREKNQNMIAAFLESLPLNHIKERDVFLNRRTTLFDANLATMIPFVSDVSGSSTPDEIYVGRKGGLAFFHRYDSDTNFNMSIVAESGGGKSFNTGNRHAHALAAGRQVRVIDVGRSYEFLCQELGGEYIHLTDERNPCFNFFTNILETPSGDIHPDEIDSIIPMVGFLCGLDISQQVAAKGEDNTSARYASIIIKAINIAYRKNGRQSGLKDVADAFLEIAKDYKVQDQAPEKLYESIWPYSHGPYSKYFNGENNIHYSKDYVVLELEEVAQKDTRLKAAIIFSLIIQIMREVFIQWSKIERRTDVDIDEAWMLFTLAVASEFMESAARRFRKYGSSLCVITQGIDDAYKNPTTKAIWENSAHRIYLKMKHSSIEQALKENKLVMGEFEKEWFKTLVTDPGKFSELFVETKQMYGVARLVTDQFSYGFFTTTRDEKTQIKSLARQYNMDVYGVLKMLTEKNPIWKILVDIGGVSPLAVKLALRYQAEEEKDRKIGEILMEMGLKEDILEKALKIQEEQLTWEKVFVN